MWWVTEIDKKVARAAIDQTAIRTYLWPLFRREEVRGGLPALLLLFVPERRVLRAAFFAVLAAWGARIQR
jgi:hypothetical protein